MTKYFPHNLQMDLCCLNDCFIIMCSFCQHSLTHTNENYILVIIAPSLNDTLAYFRFLLSFCLCMYMYMLLYKKLEKPSLAGEVFDFLPHLNISTKNVKVVSQFHLFYYAFDIILFYIILYQKVSNRKNCFLLKAL